MYIKHAEHSRVASYGVALGLFPYAVWRGLARSFAPKDFELGVRGEDVFINLVEVKKENWSFGNGIAQYVT